MRRTAQSSPTPRKEVNTLDYFVRPITNYRGIRLSVSASWSSKPSRSGIGADTSEWEAPQRLSNSLGGSRDGNRKLGSNEAAAESKYASSDDEKSVYTRDVPTQKIRMIKKSLYDEEEEAAERSLKGRLPRGRRDEDSNSSEDDDFDRDFYLSEEAQTLRDDSQSSSAFLGSSKKFKEREQLMEKSRSRGDTKIAGGYCGTICRW